LWLDNGNHRNAGQVLLGDVGELDFMRQHLDGKEGIYTHLPNAALLFPQLLEPETPSESDPEIQDDGLSCAARVAMGRQGLFVNDLVSSIAAHYIGRILYRQPIQSFASFVDGDTLSVRSLPICRDELLPYLEQP
jgi:hypothetical protein